MYSTPLLLLFFTCCITLLPKAEEFACDFETNLLNDMAVLLSISINIKLDFFYYNTYMDVNLEAH